MNVPGRFRNVVRALLGCVVATGCLMLVPNIAVGQSQLAFPGDEPGRVISRFQRKAETHYQAGEFDKAFWYFRKELAPIGDKYAQYMVGYMMHHGEGVPRDPVSAAAWFSLAAERGHTEIVKLVEQYSQSLSAQQLESARQEVLSLKEELGDVALIKALIRRDMQRLRETTGTRTYTKSCRQNARTYLIEQVGSLPIKTFCEFLNKRIEKRLEYVGGYVEYGELEMVPDEYDKD